MATDSVIDYMLTKGRTPSFNSAGQVRGFRSRPGAPQADPTQNIGALGTTPSSQTPQGAWNQMFRNTRTNNFGASGVNPRYVSSFPGRDASASAVDTAMNEILGIPAGNDPEDSIAPLSGFRKPPPSLNILAGGGPTHAQSWGGDSLAKTLKGGWQTGDSTSIWKKYGTSGENMRISTGGDDKTITSGYKNMKSPGGYIVGKTALLDF